MLKRNLLTAAQLLASLTNRPHIKNDAIGIIRAGADGKIPVYWFNDLKISTCFSNFKYDLPHTYSDGPAQLTCTSLRALAVAESTIVINFEFTGQDYDLLEKMQGEKIDGNGNLLVFRHPANTKGTVTVTRDQLFVYEHDLMAYADKLKAPVEVATKGKRKWTPDKLAVLAAYRAAHTMPETALKFGISESRIKILLPTKKPKPSPFPGRIYRAM